MTNEERMFKLSLMLGMVTGSLQQIYSSHYVEKEAIKKLLDYLYKEIDEIYYQGGENVLDKKDDV